MRLDMNTRQKICLDIYSHLYKGHPSNVRYFQLLRPLQLILDLTTKEFMM